jgi:hypothetical protein
MKIFYYWPIELYVLAEHNKEPKSLNRIHNKKLLNLLFLFGVAQEKCDGFPSKMYSIPEKYQNLVNSLFDGE